MKKLDYRADFPVLVNNPELIYLDSSASSLKPNEVIKKITQYYEQYGVNIHRGIYQLSYQASLEYDETRAVVAKFINAETNEIVFTKGATESLNMIAEMLASSLSEGDEIITSVLEHHSSFMPWQKIAKDRGCKLVFVPLVNGHITVEGFKSCLNSRTKIVALTFVSNVLGYFTPMKEIVSLAHDVGAIVIGDAAQLIPHAPLDVREIDIDFAAFSAHKMLGPTGVGVLFGKYSHLKKLEPVQLGGDMNDFVTIDKSSYKVAPFKFEAGTPPISGVIALKASIKYLESIGLSKVHQHEVFLANECYKKMKQMPQVEVYNDSIESGIIAFNIKGIHPHDAATFFAHNNVALRAGHHCAQLLTNYLQIKGSLRISFYVYNTVDDYRNFINVLANACEFFKDWRID